MCKKIFREKDEKVIEKEIESSLRHGLPPQHGTSKIIVNREKEKERLMSLIIQEDESCVLSAKNFVKI